MLISAEIRWFFSNVSPPKLEEWFRDATEDTCPARDGESRVDECLYDRNQIELGLKHRAGKADAGRVCERKVISPSALTFRSTTRPGRANHLFLAPVCLDR